MEERWTSQISIQFFSVTSFVRCPQGKNIMKTLIITKLFLNYPFTGVHRGAVGGEEYCEANDKRSEGRRLVGVMRGMLINGGDGLPVESIDTHSGCVPGLRCGGEPYRCDGLPGGWLLNVRLFCVRLHGRWQRCGVYPQRCCGHRQLSGGFRWRGPERKTVGRPGVGTMRGNVVRLMVMVLRELLMSSGVVSVHSGLSQMLMSSGIASG